jgi:hypothetical protein
MKRFFKLIILIFIYFLFKSGGELYYLEKYNFLTKKEKNIIHIIYQNGYLPVSYWMNEK